MKTVGIHLIKFIKIAFLLISIIVHAQNPQDIVAVGTQENPYMISEFWTRNLMRNRIVLSVYDKGRNESGYYGFDITKVSYGYDLVSLERIAEKGQGAKGTRTVCGTYDRNKLFAQRDDSELITFAPDSAINATEIVPSNCSSCGVNGTTGVTFIGLSGDFVLVSNAVLY